MFEHTRHSPSEVFHHKDESLGDRPPEVDVNGTEPAEEELNVLGALQTAEVGRRLNIVGDVGVGKTTFIKHLAAVHLTNANFLATAPIYIDFADFNASLVDSSVLAR